MKAIAGILALALTALVAEPANANQAFGAVPVKAEVTASCLLTVDNAKLVVTCVKGTTILLRSTSISLQQVTAMLAAYSDVPQPSGVQEYKLVTVYL